MSSQFRFSSPQKRKVKNTFGREKFGVHQKQMGAQGLKKHNKIPTDVIL